MAPAPKAAKNGAAPLKMRPKLGMPRELSKGLFGMARMALLLWGATYLPQLKNSLNAKELVKGIDPVEADGHGGGHEDAGHGGHGHGHDTHLLDMQATLGIVAMLIVVTIAFEKAKHHLEHTVPPLMSTILSALFGELTVLGFIALYAFFMLQTGVIDAVSIVIYGDEHHLLHLFEMIHFMLFFVMVIFLFQARHASAYAHARPR